MTPRGLTARCGTSSRALRTLLTGDDPERAARQIETRGRGTAGSGVPVFPMVWLGATMQLAAGRFEVGRRLAEVAASVAAPDGWGEVGVAMLRSELALHDGELVAAERAALQALRPQFARACVRGCVTPWSRSRSSTWQRAGSIGPSRSGERRPTSVTPRDSATGFLIARTAGTQTRPARRERRMVRRGR